MIQADEVTETVESEVKDRFEQKEPSESEKIELREQHRGHLVRSTTSTLSVDNSVELPGVEVDTKIQVPDTFCFTCDEWIGLSGVELAGKPRSKKEAYYLGGVPGDVKAARRHIRDGLAQLMGVAVDRVDRVDSVDEAREFVETQLEQTEFTVSNHE